MFTPAPFDPEIWNRHAILSCDEMRRAEVLSCARGDHTFWDLMLVAGRAVAGAVMDRYAPRRVLVLCGAGNNGGDGYVAAQALREAGWDVRVGALASPMALEAQKAAVAWMGPTEALSPALLEGIDLVIDALFGTGLTRALDGMAAQMALAVTERNLPVVAADMPSGIDGNTGRVLGPAFKAEVTVTFFRKKRGHVLLPALAQCGEVVVVETGMHADVLNEINPVIAENDSALWSAFQQKHEVQNNKYDRGHALIFGGALMTGAARLAARAAQRMGAGLVTLAAPLEAWEIYAKSMESVMVRPLHTIQDEEELLANPKINAILIGCGLGRDEGRREQILRILATRKICVLDADALSVFADDPDSLLKNLHENCILTPHEGEFLRLFGDSDADKIVKTQKAAQKAGCLVLLKGANTVIAHPNGSLLVNLNAPPWLATAGSGDVLAGMILGVVTTGMPLLPAVCAAAHIHGAAAQAFGVGLIAEDIIDQIPAILKVML